MFEIQIGVFFEVSHNHRDPNHRDPNQTTKVQTKQFSCKFLVQKVVASKQTGQQISRNMVENFHPGYVELTKSTLKKKKT